MNFYLEYWKGVETSCSKVKNLLKLLKLEQEFNSLYNNWYIEADYHFKICQNIHKQIMIQCLIIPKIKGIVITIQSIQIISIGN